MNLFDKRTAQVLFTVLLFAGILAFLFLARKPLLVFLFAILFAYLLEPVVSRVQPLTRHSRGTAITVVYLLLLAVLVLLGFLVGSRVIGEVHRLAQVLPDLYEKINTGNIALQLGQRHGWSLETQIKVRSFLAAHQNEVVSAITSLGSRLALIATNAGWVGLIPILAVFFLKDQSRLRTMTGGIADDLITDRRKKELLQNVLRDLDNMLAQFVRAQLLLVIISWAAYTIVLGAMRVPYAFALGAIGGLLEFIPLVGPVLAAALILGVSFTSNYAHLIVIVIFLGVWRVCTDYSISPRLLGGKVNISPLAAIFGVLVGGELAGVVGIYLATPALATIRILWKHWVAFGRTCQPEEGDALQVEERPHAPLGER